MGMSRKASPEPELRAVASMAEKSVRSIMEGFGAKSAENFGRIFAGMFNLDPIPQAVKPPIETFARATLMPRYDAIRYYGLPNPALRNIIFSLIEALADD